MLALMLVVVLTSLMKTRLCARNETILFSLQVSSLKFAFTALKESLKNESLILCKQKRLKILLLLHFWQLIRTNMQISLITSLCFLES